MALSTKTLNTLIDALASKDTANAIVASVNARNVPAGKASATATLPGMTTPVTLQAVTAGTAGNSIVITADGTDTITALVAAWNTAHPSNQVAVASGTASQIPTSGSFTLSGGTAAGVAIALTQYQQTRIIDMMADQKAGQEVIAAIASGAALSNNACRKLVQGMAGDGAGAAGNEMINFIQSAPRASKFNL